VLVILEPYFLTYVVCPSLRGALDTTVCDKFCQWLAAGRWFSPATPVSSTNKTDHHEWYDWNIFENGVKHHNPTPLYVECHWCWEDNKFWQFINCIWHHASQNSNYCSPIKASIQCRVTVTRPMPLVEQELLTLPYHLSLPPVFSEVRFAQSSVFCVVCCCLLLWNLDFIRNKVHSESFTSILFKSLSMRKPCKTVRKQGWPILFKICW